MKTIFLSPHLDDAVFSCGGWIWDQSCQGREIEIWTICAGDPPQETISGLALDLHRSWQLGGDAVQVRRQEDREACQLVGAAPRHFPFLDCIYRADTGRQPYYQSVSDLFSGLDPGEAGLIAEVSAQLASALPEEVELVAPLGIGNHVDHELTRKAAARLGRPLLYYADFPYAREEQGLNILRFMNASPDWKAEIFPISKSGLEKWTQAARQYGSQIPTFWPDEGQLRAELVEFSAASGGISLWSALED